MVTLPSPPPSTWEGARTEAMPAGHTHFTLAPGSSFLRITVDNLRPNHLITARIRIRTNQAGQYVVIRLGDDAKRFPRATYYTSHVRTTTLGTSLIIEVTGIPTGVVEELTITDETPLPDNPRPCDVLSLQAYYPVPGFFGLRWNNDRWNRASWTRGVAKPWAMVWDSTPWDTRAWNVGETNVSQWQDITGPCTEINDRPRDGRDRRHPDRTRHQRPEPARHRLAPRHPRASYSLADPLARVYRRHHRPIYHPTQAR